LGSMHGQAHQRSDLFHLRLGVIAGGAGAEYLSQHHVGYTPYDAHETPLAALADGRVDAVVANIPALRYLVSQRYQGTLIVADTILEPVSYAIGLPTDSPLRNALNHALIDIIEQDRWHDVEQQYLGHS